MVIEESALPTLTQSSAPYNQVSVYTACVLTCSFLFGFIVPFSFFIKISSTVCCMSLFDCIYLFKMKFVFRVTYKICPGTTTLAHVQKCWLMFTVHVK